MKQHLNTLYVTRDDTWLSKDGETVRVHSDGKCLLRVPLHNLEGIVAMGWNVLVSPQLMGYCAEQGIAISFCTPHGNFLASVQGKMNGNVLLRREQYRVADCEEKWMKIASRMIVAKISNCRILLQRIRRTYGADDLTPSIDFMAKMCLKAKSCTQSNILRGVEGTCAEMYFSSLFKCLRVQDPQTITIGRTRRPPMDPYNALLSFLYTFLYHDTKSALETAGLDSAVGFLHRDRSGRFGLALDLMEEFRAPMADRLMLTLFNRKQLTLKDFEVEESKAVFLKEEARKKVITAWQEKKKEEILHPWLNEKMTLGMVVHMQARLLARAIRGDAEEYLPFLWR